METRTLKGITKNLEELQSQGDSGGNGIKTDLEGAEAFFKAANLGIKYLELSPFHREILSWPTRKVKAIRRRKKGQAREHER